MVSTTCSWRGTLYPAMWPRQWTWISSSVGTRSPRGWTMAATRWPHRSSGAPTTMASSTSGCDRTADSTSSGKIFSPPELIETEPRPSRVMVPFSSMVAKSPGIVNRVPSTVMKTSAVLTGSL